MGRCQAKQIFNKYLKTNIQWQGADTAMVDNTIYHGELVTTGPLQHSQGWPPNNSSIFRLPDISFNTDLRFILGE